jgi:hypothetical protein
MTTRNLEPDQWRNREEWRLVSGRGRQLLKKNGMLYGLYLAGMSKYLMVCNQVNPFYIFLFNVGRIRYGLR